MIPRFFADEPFCPHLPHLWFSVIPPCYLLSHFKKLLCMSPPFILLSNDEKELLALPFHKYSITFVPLKMRVIIQRTAYLMEPGFFGKASKRNHLSISLWDWARSHKACFHACLYHKSLGLFHTYTYYRSGTITFRRWHMSYQHCFAVYPWCNCIDYYWFSIPTNKWSHYLLLTKIINWRGQPYCYN